MSKSHHCEITINKEIEIMEKPTTTFIKISLSFIVGFVVGLILGLI